MISADPSVQIPDHAPVAVFLAQNLARGGAERVFLQLVREVRQPRPLPVLVQGVATLAEDEGMADDLVTLATGSGSLPGVGPRRLLDRLDETPFGAALSFPLKALRLRRIVRERDAALVSTFLPKAHMISALARATGLRDRVYVMNVHCFLSQHLEHHFSPRVRPMARRLLSAAMRRADAVFAVSEGVREDLIATLDLDPEKVHVVWNPLDLERIRAGAAAGVPADELPGAPPGTFTLVGVGRLTRLKGFHLLVEALAHLPEDLSVRVVLVGEGPEHGALEERARALGVEDAVHVVGEQDNPWRFMAGADLLVHPSYTEAFPNVFGEAMALGIPVVATECSPGVREYLEGGATGALVPPDDPRALAEAIARLLRDPGARAELAERGRARVEPFALQRAVGAYAERLLQLLEARAGAAAVPGRPATAAVPDAATANPEAVRHP